MIKRGLNWRHLTGNSSGGAEGAEVVSEICLPAGEGVSGAGDDDRAEESACVKAYVCDAFDECRGGVESGEGVIGPCESGGDAGLHAQYHRKIERYL